MKSTIPLLWIGVLGNLGKLKEIVQNRTISLYLWYAHIIKHETSNGKIFRQFFLPDFFRFLELLTDRREGGIRPFFRLFMTGFDGKDSCLQ